MMMQAISNEQILLLYDDYVSHNEHRDTKRSCQEVDLFTAFCDGAFRRNYQVKNELYNRMMECCVSYEQMGFVAGIQYATRIATVGIPIEKEDGKQPQDSKESQDNKQTQDSPFISTREISQIFHSENWKVVERIEKQVIPKCSKETKVGFVKCAEQNRSNKEVNVIRLDHAASIAYLQYLENRPYRKQTNVNGRIANFRKLIQERFKNADKKIAV